MTTMDDPLRVIEATHGVFLRREVLAVGLNDRALRRAIADGHWVRVRHGAYVFTDTWVRADAEERHRIMAMAVVRTHPGRVALSHQTACLMHGLDLWNMPLQQVHVTRLDGAAGRGHRDVVHHEGVCLESDLAVVKGRHLTRPVRAVLETALLGDVERGLVVADSGLHRGLFDRDELAAQHELMRFWPGAQHLQVVTRLADGASESVGETRGRFLFWSNHIPRPTLQYDVREGGRLIGRTDFAWPEFGLLGEFDGRVKYGRLLRPGQSAGDAVFEEKLREDALRRATGWAMVRFTWADLDNSTHLIQWMRHHMRLAS